MIRPYLFASAYRDRHTAGALQIQVGPAGRAGKSLAMAALPLVSAAVTLLGVGLVVNGLIAYAT